MMLWGGSDEKSPCALATLGSIGSLGRSQNAKISSKLSAHMKETLGINSDR